MRKTTKQTKKGAKPDSNEIAPVEVELPIFTAVTNEWHGSNVYFRLPTLREIKKAGVRDLPFYHYTVSYGDVDKTRPDKSFAVFQEQCPDAMVDEISQDLFSKIKQSFGRSKRITKQRAIDILLSMLIITGDVQRDHRITYTKAKNILNKCGVSLTPLIFRTIVY